MFTLRVPCEVVPPPPLFRTNRTRRVPHPVLIGHAASLSQVVKTRAMTGISTSPIEAARCIMRTGGPGAFFTGYWGLALVEYPFNIVEVFSPPRE